MTPFGQAWPVLAGSVFRRGDDSLTRERKQDGGFPDARELKRRVRDRLFPEREPGDLERQPLPLHSRRENNMNMIGIRARHATPGKIFLWGLLFAASQAALALMLGKAGVAETLLQLQLTTDAHTFITTAAELSDPQMQALIRHFYLDFLHPLWYGAFLLTFTAWLFNRLGVSRGWNFLLWGAPLMAGLDLLENAIHLPVLLGHLPANELTIGTAGMAATTKWGLGGFFLVLDTALIMAALFSSRGRRAP